MATIPVVAPTRAGAVFALAAANGGGDQFANTGRELFIVNNGGAGACVVSFAIQQTVDGKAVAARQVVVAPGVQKAIGPFSAPYNDASGFVQVTYDQVLTVTVGVLQTGSP